MAYGHNINCKNLYNIGCKILHVRLSKLSKIFSQNILTIQ